MTASPWRARRSAIAAIAPPYVWLVIFLLLPFFLVLKISLADLKFGIPPYTSLVSFKDQVLDLTVHLRGYILLFSDSLYIDTYLNSLKIAAITTLC